ncbi:MAG: PdxA family dehydrogenase [Candidatus Limimorpha sp.]
MQTSNSKERPVRIGIAHGDINGIGYEIVLKAFQDSRLLSMCTPILYGHSKVLSYYKKNFSISDFNYSLTRDARQAWPNKFNIINITEDELKIEPGVPSALAGKMSVLSLKRAADDLQYGHIDAFVSLPVHLPGFKSEAFEYSSPVAFLSSFFGVKSPLHMLLSDRLRIGVATDRVGLKMAVESLSRETLRLKVKQLVDSMKKDFGIASPKVAVLGLNPEMEEQSNAEESTIIAPVVKEMCREGYTVFGPFAADDFFNTDAWKRYDAVLAMYYDQALMPFRFLSVNGGCMYLAGLPVVCVAPDHGVRYDIANQDKASPDSFRQALYQALDIVNRRRKQ